MKPHVTAALVLAAALSGCAMQPTGANYRPMVDQRSAGANYEADLAECQQYAAQRAGAGTGAVAGAAAGAIFGLLLNAAIGGGFRHSLAGAGALSGAVSGASANEGTQREIIRRCLQGRGISVLD